MPTAQMTANYAPEIEYTQRLREKHKTYKERSPQALRYNKDKTPLSFLLDFPNATAGVARVLEFGAKKYARNNWRQGLPFTEVTDSLLRHLQAFHSGEDVDPESGLPHIDHALCNMLFLAEFFRIRPEYDDRTMLTTGAPNGT